MCLYSNDSTFSLSAEDPAELKEAIDTKYLNIVDYMSKNRLVLNTDKTRPIYSAWPLRGNTGCTTTLAPL